MQRAPILLHLAWNGDHSPPLFPRLARLRGLSNVVVPSAGKFGNLFRGSINNEIIQWDINVRFIGDYFAGIFRTELTR